MGPKKKRQNRNNKTRDPMRCLKCGHKSLKKNGFVQAQQRWKCKDCNYQFTRTEPRGRPFWQKSLATFLHSYGMSMHAIARIFQVQPSTVLKWVHEYGDSYTPRTDNGISLMHMHEMQRLLKQKNRNTLCIAINSDAFKESLGIAIR